MKTNLVVDRVVGSLLGVHLGDSLGSTWEFSPAHRLADEPDVGRMVGGGPFGWPVGGATDDTQQTLACARAFAGVLLHSGPGVFLLDDLINSAGKALDDWYATNPRDVGSTTGAALSARQSPRPGAHGVGPWATHRSVSNGAMMRAAPCAFVTTIPAARARLARDVCAITHQSAVAQDLVELYVELLAALAEGGRLLPQWRRVLDRVQQYLPALTDMSHPFTWDDDALFRDGSSFTALRMALWALHRSDDVGPFQALLEVIRCGGDTDTNAAIAGGMLGAAWGSWYWLSTEPGPKVLELLEHGVELMDLGGILAQQQPATDSRLRSWAKT